MPGCEIKVDYHIHTKYCQHAKGEMQAYVEYAIDQGLHEIGFADHVPVSDDYDPWHRMALNQFPIYIETIQKLRETFPEINIRLGIEADVYPGFEKSLESILKKFPVEYVIGSVHFMDGEPVFKRPETNWNDAEIEQFIRKYFNWHHQGVEAGLFDIIAHTDVIKWHFSAFTPLIEELSAKLYDAAAKAGMAIELNTSGMRKKPGEMYPSRRILDLAFQRNIPVVPASDAHSPEEVAYGFREAKNILTDCGYTEIKKIRKNLTAYVKP